ncbi:glycerophosphodiester phosphodiesterase family protein [Flectobacillus rivi]|uniref:Glycerophosphodiester phosphodiesterase family protein n=1 Tax=Flectobacillus rivi TaxID=2984209 RepID=A0ABT6Z089_9BACT|nr:glycerophosphodiester phosphodiesterase family protein [Flectobacillus rivi]MDI9874550.1 glycerophosphodiester phosphodiesterase family protein [Flectobacillus rivi]
MIQSIIFQGHRGCRGLLPENTIPAFLEALKYPIDYLELDVCLSKDLDVVVSHEPYINSLFSSYPTGKAVRKSEEKNLNLFQLSYEQIRSFDVGQRGNKLFPEQKPMAAHKPLLAEMLKACETQRKKYPDFGYNIEIKSEEREYGISQPQEVNVFCDKVFEILKNINPEHIIVQSFDFNILKYCKQQMDLGVYPKVQLSALVTNEGVRPSLEKLGFLPDFFSPYYKSLTEGKIEICHQKGIRVVPWTINKIEDMRRLIIMGVDGIITDYPNRIDDILS